jgi:hypothetical protein
MHISKNADWQEIDFSVMAFTFVHYRNNKEETVPQCGC